MAPVRFNGEFTDKVAIVTGAGRGIGAAYAHALCDEGAAVVCADIDVDAASAVAAKLQAAGGRAIALQVDVAAEDSVLAMARHVVDRFEAIDILVNNAALYGGMRMDPLTDVTVDYWNRVLAVNLTSILLCSRACAPFMGRHGRGKIINQSSAAAFGGAGAYSIAKLGVIGLTIGLAKELGPRGINVNCIAPGVIDTDATRQTVPSEILESLVRLQAVPRPGVPDDLTGTLLYLSASLSDFLTGATLVLDGGRHYRF